MAKRKISLGVFVTSPALLGRIQALTSPHNIQVQYNTLGLDEAVPAARAMESKGVEVVIGRRGTAHLLRENLRIPVLSFPHRSLDLLITLKAASKFGRRILFPVFRQELSDVSILEDLLGIEVIQRVYSDTSSLKRAVAWSKRNAVQVVIGGGVTQQISRTIGVKFVELLTSDEDIIATIENAVSVALSGREQRATARRYHAIINAASDGIIAVDEDCRITVANAAACKALRITEDQGVGQPVVRFLPECPIPEVLSEKMSVQDRIGQIREERFVFSHQPIILDGDAIGAVSTFREIGTVIRSENVVRHSLSAGLVAKYSLEQMIHASEAMKNVMGLARRYAQTDSTVLVIGETGTGKEIVAQGIHQLSHRAKFPFVSINCAAMPEQLLESELFGHDEGAFTGSKRGGKLGRFELAHQGTIFLDEIDSTSEAMQIRLLRVLQEREVMRVGGDRVIPVNVRVIAASSRDLNSQLLERKFRTDLFFRLNVLQITIPPLRQRREDIPVLLEFFIRMYSNRQQIKPVRLPQLYLDGLQQYAWPGNVRQLKNFAERLVLNYSLKSSSETLETLYHELVQFSGSADVKPDRTMRQDSIKFRDQLREKSIESEKAIILEALHQTRYRLSQAAVRLGISRTTLWRKMKDMGLR